MSVANSFEQLVFLKGMKDPQFMRNAAKELGVSESVIVAAKEVYDKEVGGLAAHPSYQDARALLLDSMRKRLDVQVPKSDESAGRPPVPSIRSVGYSPALFGLKPPFLPAQKIEIVNDHDEIMWEELITWLDSVFLAASILEGVSSHAENLQDMIARDQIAWPEGNGYDDAVTRIENSIASIRRLLSSRDVQSSA